jgi:RNA polymerase sigma factor (sigma-70 family)
MPPRRWARACLPEQLRTLSAGSIVLVRVEPENAATGALSVTTDTPCAALLAAIERCRKRLWTLCYRMTGSRTESDDLSQEAIARAIERECDLVDRRSLEGWLFRIATTVCLDHLRRRRRSRAVTELVDPLDLPELQAGGSPVNDPETATILREDVRFAIVVALQRLSLRQRAAILLHDVCDRSLTEVAETLGISANAVKALLHRARVALSAGRVHTDLDPVAGHLVDHQGGKHDVARTDSLQSL